MHSLIEDIAKKGVVVTDGSWGTQMQARGLTRGENPDSWNLTRPDKVEEVAASYVQAGSDIILTNTFGANRFVLEQYGLKDKVEEVNKSGVEISRKASGGKSLIFASIGPSGKVMITGEVSEKDLAEAFDIQARALASAGADAIVVETMMDLNEMKIALAAAKSTGLPVVASMVYDSGKNKDRTIYGNTPEQAAEELTAAGADAVGANCGQGIEGFVPICKRLHDSTGLPIWIKPNAGLPEVINGQVSYNTTPDEFAGYIPALVEAGASFIGGCCGTNHEFIKTIKNKLSNLNS